MPEPMDPEYLRETQQIIAAVPNGRWEPITNDYGVPDAVGPISFLETASDEYQVPVILFVQHAREALPRYVGEVSRQADQIRFLERRIRALESAKDGAHVRDSLAFPWARTYDADQLAAFIEDLWGAASGDDDLQTLDAIERAVAEHRPDDVPCPLSEREVEILTEVASGETRDSAARNLGISTESLRGRCPQIYARLGARNATHAAAIATHHGWITGARIPTLTELPTRIVHGPMRWNRLYQARAAEMRKRPGLPVEIGPYGSQSGARGASRRIRKGLFEPFRPAGAFDARPVRTDDGQWIVRASYAAAPTSTEKAAS